ncbi:LysM peptidoglycan-binding domain-containing protein [Halomonas campisalis]|uniref:LysM peptidoglycan-binding domain-containing protein n=1 Tax=Billgrantia campisalis TaxID=74661 RepID=A0ABS9P857_9GAMM|nr:LysM peptidoglycan-binding domain-containing protein [Halomonas campisalis]MCG6657957.1 LysM peptidoglycan-binding domain-containing protein [Halomonas campisalis]MDR5863518.1 LysM peptidoglycan-binding domain-containing protein [Halomonas campisalis]
MTDSFLDASQGAKRRLPLPGLLATGVLVAALAAPALAEQDAEAYQALQDEHAALQAEQESLQSELEASRSQLAEQESEAKTLRGQIETLEAQLAEAREKAAEAAEMADEAREALNDEAGASEEVNALAVRVAELEQALQEAERERDIQYREHHAELAALRSRLPPEEGGTLELESAQASARLTAQAMRTAERDLRRAGGGDAARQADLEQLGDELEQDQRLVSRVQGGTLYRVRRGESLAGIAGRYYGNANRWPEIHEANEHVLENPDHVWPGMTLILP